MLDLTDRDILLLVKYSYMDLSAKPDYAGYNADVMKLIVSGAGIGETDRYFLTEAGAARRQNGRVRFNFPAVMAEVRRDDRINGLRLIAHENLNVKPGDPGGAGLVMSAFTDAAQKDVVLLIRGSEGGMFAFADDWVERIARREWTDVIKSEDWRDNFNMAFGTLACFEPAAAFTDSVMRKFPGKAYSVYGHSKGGGVAVYLAARYGFPGAAVDGVGLPAETLLENPWYKERLERESANFVNKRAENDIVSELLIHFEKTERLAMNRRFMNENGLMVSPFGPRGFANAHYPDALALDPSGMCYPGTDECPLPSIVGVINKALMLSVTYEKLSAEQKAANAALVESVVSKAAKVIDRLSEETE